MPAGSRLVSTFLFPGGPKSVEMSLDAADTSVRATSLPRSYFCAGTKKVLPTEKSRFRKMGRNHLSSGRKRLPTGDPMLGGRRDRQHNWTMALDNGTNQS